MDRDEWAFKAVAENRGHRYEIKTRTFASAERAAKQIMNHNEIFDSARVEDRKGNVIKVVRKDG